MINRDDIEAGDKVYTRDGGCLVARKAKGGLVIFTYSVFAWNPEGSFICSEDTHPLDIIRIEKAPLKAREATHD